MRTSYITALRLLRPKALVAFALIFMIGCSTAAKFRSKKDESYEGKLGRGLIVYYGDKTHQPLGRSFSRRLAERLRDSLGKGNVPCELVTLDSSDMDRAKPIEVAAERFQATHVLFFTFPRMDVNSSVYWPEYQYLPNYNHSLVVTLEIDVQDLKTGKTVWRTAADYYAAPRPETVAEQLVEQLRAAKLL